MWLVYLRFEDNGKIRTYHVRTGNKQDVQHIISRAEKHGLTATSRLEEYAAFYTSGSINLKPMIVPNFHFYLDSEWHKKWEEVEQR